LLQVRAQVRVKANNFSVQVIPALIVISAVVALVTPAAAARASAVGRI
jgi:hypothetical protein